MEYSCRVRLHRNENKPASTTGKEMGESHRCRSEQKYQTQKYVWQGSMYVKFKTRLSLEARAASSYLSEVEDLWGVGGVLFPELHGCLEFVKICQAVSL